MADKKKIGKEILRFFITALGSLVLWLYLFALLEVEYSIGVLSSGVLVTLIFAYVVRLTIKVLKQNIEQ